jgi:hypothetical protein
MADNNKRGKTNKRKGNDAERYYAEKFRELGFENCKTSRQGAKMLDDCGIDLIFIPFNVQIKSGLQQGLRPHKVLEYMKNRISEVLPKSSIEHTLPKIMIHKRQVGQGNKRDEFSEIVSMTFEDFSKIIKMIEWKKD